MTTHRIKFFNSIRFRLSAIIASVILCAIAALSAYNAAQSLDRETENFRTLTAGAATAYAAAISDDVAEQNKMQALSALRGIRDLKNIVQTDVTLPNGEVFVELGTGAWLLNEDTVEESLWRVDQIRIEIPIIKGGEQIGTLGMLADIRPLRAQILQSLVRTIASSIVIALIGILLSQVFVSRLIAPLQALTKEMANIRDGRDLNVADLKERDDETGLLTKTFADMIGTIDERDRQIANHIDTLEDTVDERTRDLRVARDAAEAANAAKSDFLATMSHEIRTPMNGMMVMAEMLGTADLTPRHKRYADIIHRSGNSLLTIINDILDLSKIEAGQLDLEIIPASPERLATDVSSLFWEKARASKLELATYVSPNVPEEILVDPTRLNQVISNLVNNALKFTETGGVLIHVDAEQAGDQTITLKIEVIDTGIGIPEDKIDHIFESFSQADQSTTRQFGGTGLGLTVCRRLVTAMNGKIWVTSELGQGSVFHVEVPVAIHQPAPKFPASDLSVGIKLPEGVLERSLAQSLRDYGCTIQATDPDFWISNSVELSPETAPVILLSDLGDTRADRLLDSGQAQDLIANPFDRSDIADLLEKAKSGRYRGVAALDGKADNRNALRHFEGLRVLAVDDNAVNREVLREALSTLRAEAVFAEDGQQAIDIFQAEQFDIVLMDGSMPVMDGFEATRQMRACEAAGSIKPTPIFALTAQVVGETETAWSEAGANGHILKPFTLEKLCSILAEVSDGASAAVEVEEVKEDTLELPPIFDDQTIAQLDSLGSTPGGIRAKVWGMFEDKAPEMLKGLHDAIQIADHDEIARRAHAFKSMALSSGLSGLASALQSLEENAKGNGARAQSSILMEPIQLVFDETLTKMRENACA